MATRRNLYTTDNKREEPPIWRAAAGGGRGRAPACERLICAQLRRPAQTLGAYGQPWFGRQGPGGEHQAGHRSGLATDLSLLRRDHGRGPDLPVPRRPELGGGPALVDGAATWPDGSGRERRRHRGLSEDGAQPPRPRIACGDGVVPCGPCSPRAGHRPCPRRVRPGLVPVGGLCEHSVQRGRGIECPAVHLWRSLGFQIIGTVPESFDHPGHGLIGLHIMYRRL